MCAAPTPIRVVVVDDSVTIRRMFTHFLNADPGIVVVGSAENPYEARELIKQVNPDVVTLDIEMPKMDGLSFLDKIMTLRPMPVVMVSTLTQKGAESTIRALEAGALDYIAKPTDLATLESIRGDLLGKVKSAARVKVKPKTAARHQTDKLSFTGDAHNWLIAIGASTGGVEAIRDLLMPMPDNLPPIMITQHMPASFTEAFAKRLDGMLAPKVMEAKNGMPLNPGHVYIAPGGYHLCLIERGSQLKAQLDDGPAVSGHKPSVDVMFESLAKCCGKRTIAAILTGMGKDGAEGMKALRDTGAKTLGQSEASCVVYGMPKAAKAAGGIEKEYSLSQLPITIVSIANTSP